MYLKPKKSLGQNFLIDKNIQKKIIHYCEFKPNDIVLEIGAGRGELTRLIADRVKIIYALEIDPYLCRILEENLKGYKNVKIINQDILKFDFRRQFKRLKDRINPALSATQRHYLSRKGGVKVIGNIPYYITTPIIEYLLRYKNMIDNIFLTVQKEFARRMVAKVASEDYSSLSCFVQFYTKPEILFLIKKSCFLPVPKVDSCFVKLDILDKPAVKVRNQTLFFRIIRFSFNQRRKTLRNSLRGIVSAHKLGIFFNQYNIDINIRPEDLSLEDFANLTNV